MKVIIEKTNMSDFIIVNGTAVNIINGKIDLLDYMKRQGALNDAEIKAIEDYILKQSKPKKVFKKYDPERSVKRKAKRLKRFEKERLKEYIRGVHKKRRSWKK